MKLKVDKLTLNVPHPAAFALQKLIVSSRRMKKEKGLKEKQEALRIINCLIAKGEEGIIKRLFDSMPKKWRTKVIKALEDYEEKDILDFLN